MPPGRFASSARPHIDYAGQRPVRTLWTQTNSSAGLEPLSTFQSGRRFIALHRADQLGQVLAKLLTTLDVPLAPLWVWLAFGEVPSSYTLAGGSIVLLAVAGHIWHEMRKEQVLAVP